MRRRERARERVRHVYESVCVCEVGKEEERGGGGQTLICLSTNKCVAVNILELLV